MTLWLLLFVLNIAVAQQKHTISGTIKDSSNGETISGAVVFLQDTNISTTTNAYGFYSLTAEEGSYTLSVSYNGFYPTEKAVELHQNIKINVEIEEEIVKLDDVVATAQESKKVDLQSPQMSVAKLSTKTIKQIPAVLGEVDIIKSIQLLPGVTNAGEGASGFNVRGGAEDQNLVLLDEAVIYNSSHLFGFFSIFNADAVKDIKL